MLGALPAVVGGLQATEVLKRLLGRGESLSGRLVLYDALAMEFRTVRLRRDPACPTCGEEPSIVRLEPRADYEAGQPEPDPASAPETGFPLHLDVLWLRKRLEGAHPPVLVDVREGWEVAMGMLPGAVHVPLGTLPGRIGELPADREIVVYCHAGVRSWQAMEFLRASGLERVASLDGGTDAWSVHVDPGLPRY